MARPQYDTPLVSFFNCAESAWMANLKHTLHNLWEPFLLVTPVSWQATTHSVKVWPKSFMIGKQPASTLLALDRVLR
jgi:hypothetical protein